MTTITAAHSDRPMPKALLPWLLSVASHQLQAWKAARRMARADELTWNMALQDARMMADLSRAMTETAAKR